MGKVPDYAAVVWFDTYVRPRLHEPTIQKVGEQLFSRYAQSMFEGLATLEGEFSLLDDRVQAGVMYILLDSVIKYGRPVSNRYCDREVSELELENIRLEKGLPLIMKEDEDGPLGVG